MNHKHAASYSMQTGATYTDEASSAQAAGSVVLFFAFAALAAFVAISGLIRNL